MFSSTLSNPTPVNFTDSMIEQNLLPNFLVIGAAKAGTTALHAYLSEHHEIFMTRPKEPRFFLVWNNPEQMLIHERENRPEFNRYNTIEKYSELFVNGKDCAVRGESSPQYLANAHCAAKIKKLVPHAKIIVVLRNPVDRAFSHYLTYKNWRAEKKNFEEAINEEMKTGRFDYIQEMRYLSMGKYTRQLKVYLSMFSPDQLKICLYDDFKNDSLNFLKDIFRFLCVDDTFVPDLQHKHNVSFIRRYSHDSGMDKVLGVSQRGFRRLKMHSLEEAVKHHRFYKPIFKPETRKKLIGYFADEVSELEKLLNKDLSNWRQ